MLNEKIKEKAKNGAEKVKECWMVIETMIMDRISFVSSSTRTL